VDKSSITETGVLFQGASFTGGGDGKMIIIPVLKGRCVCVCVRPLITLTESL
jgi:hypothetical protein